MWCSNAAALQPCTAAAAPFTRGWVLAGCGGSKHALGAQLRQQHAAVRCSLQCGRCSVCCLLLLAVAEGGGAATQGCRLHAWVVLCCSARLVGVGVGGVDGALTEALPS